MEASCRKRPQQRRALAPVDVDEADLSQQVEAELLKVCGRQLIEPDRTALTFVGVVKLVVEVVVVGIAGRFEVHRHGLPDEQSRYGLRSRWASQCGRRGR
jgi:hypothetical protein